MAFQLGEELKNAGLNSFWKNLVTLFIKNWQKVIKFSPEILAAENVVCDGQLSNSKLYSTEGSAAPAWGRVRNNICTNWTAGDFLCSREEESSQYRIIEESLLVFAVPMSWFYLMFFAGAIKLTGPFVTMIFSMITGDMFTFSIIYVIFLFGFSQAFFFMLKGGEEDSMYNSYPTTWIALFHMTLGEYEVGGFEVLVWTNISSLSMKTSRRATTPPWRRPCSFSSKSWSPSCFSTCWSPWWAILTPSS